MNHSEPSQTQFPIRRLFWLMVVVSIVLAIGNCLGLQRLPTFYEHWFGNAGFAQRSATIAGIAFCLLMVLAYVYWISFRLPIVVESLVLMRRKRKQRRKELEQQYLRREKSQQDQGYQSDDST